MKLMLSLGTALLLCSSPAAAQQLSLPMRFDSGREESWSAHWEADLRLRIRDEDDSLLEGALIGGAVGAAAFLLIALPHASGPNASGDDFISIGFFGAVLGGSLGMAIDASL